MKCLTFDSWGQSLLNIIIVDLIGNRFPNSSTSAPWANFCKCTTLFLRYPPHSTIKIEQMVIDIVNKQLLSGHCVEVTVLLVHYMTTAFAQLYCSLSYEVLIVQKAHITKVYACVCCAAEEPMGKWMWLPQDHPAKDSRATFVVYLPLPNSVLGTGESVPTVGETDKWRHSKQCWDETLFSLSFQCTTLDLKLSKCNIAYK